MPTVKQMINFFEAGNTIYSFLRHLHDRSPQGFFQPPQDFLLPPTSYMGEGINPQSRLWIKKAENGDYWMDFSKRLALLKKSFLPEDPALDKNHPTNVARRTNHELLAEIEANPAELMPELFHCCRDNISKILSDGMLKTKMGSSIKLYFSTTIESSFGTVSFAFPQRHFLAGSINSDLGVNILSKSEATVGDPLVAEIRSHITVNTIIPLFHDTAEGKPDKNRPIMPYIIINNPGDSDNAQEVKKVLQNEAPSLRILNFAETDPKILKRYYEATAGCIFNMDYNNIKENMNFIKRTKKLFKPIIHFENRQLNKESDFLMIAQAALEIYYLPPSLRDDNDNNDLRPTGINRNQYGARHVCNVAANIELLLFFYKKYKPQCIDTDFLKDPEKLKLLKLSALYLYADDNVLNTKNLPTADRNAFNFRRDMKILGFDGSDIQACENAIKDGCLPSLYNSSNIYSKLIYGANCLEKLISPDLFLLVKNNFYSISKDLQASPDFSENVLNVFFENYREFLKMFTENDGKLALECENSDNIYLKIYSFRKEILKTQEPEPATLASDTLLLYDIKTSSSENFFKQNVATTVGLVGNLNFKPEPPKHK